MNAHQRNEEGAVAVVIAAFLLVFLGIAALTVDFGSLLETRREAVSDVDGAALAAAQYLADRPGCDSSAGWSSDAGQAAWAVIQANDASAVQADYQIDFECASGTAGKVTVTGVKDAISAFGPMFGVDNPQAGGSATAQFGDFVSGRGLRPIGVCSKDAPYQMWEQTIKAAQAAGAYPEGVKDYYPNPLQGVSPTAYAGAEYAVFRVGFGEPGEYPCATGDAEGNWGWLGFGQPGGATLKDQVDNGYDEVVNLEGPCDPTYNPGNLDCQSETGAKASLKSNLDGMTCPAGTSTQACIDSGRWMVVLAYDVATESPGTNLEYQAYRFLGVVLRDRGDDTLSGQGSGNKDEKWFDFEFIPVVDFEGQIGAAPGGGGDFRGFEMCTVDLDASGGRCFF